MAPPALKRSPSYDDEGEEEIDELEGDESSDEEDGKGKFKLRGLIDPPTAYNRTMRELHDMIHDGSIDLCPPYQREPVWPQAKQSKLIDSIFTNHYIPPLVFSVAYDKELEAFVRVCVDGKQRLTSIMRFLDGTIPYRDSKTKEAWYYTTPDSTSKTRQQIDEEHRNIFDSRRLTCVEYSELAPRSEREIFQRVQLGVALQAGEKLQAISSPRAEWITGLVKQHITDVQGKKGLRDFVTFDTKRGRDFQNLAFLAYCCEGVPNEERLPTATGIENWLQSEEEPQKTLKKKVNEVLQEFRFLAEEPRFNKGILSLQRAKRIAPVEFIFIGVLLYQISQESRAAKAKAIHTLCSSIRQEYVDVRTNSKVCKTLWRLVEELAENPTEEVTVTVKRKGTSTKNAPNKKRKIESEENRDAPATVPVQTKTTTGTSGRPAVAKKSTGGRR